MLRSRRHARRLQRISFVSTCQSCGTELARQRQHSRFRFQHVPSWSFLVLPDPPWSAFHPSSDSVLRLPLCSMPRPVSIVVDSFAQTPNCIYSSYISSLVSLLSLLFAEAKRHRLWSVHPVRSALEHCSALIAPGRLCRGLQKHLVSHLVRFLSHPGLVF